MEVLQIKALPVIPWYLHGQFAKVVGRRRDRTGARFVTVELQGRTIEFLDYHLRTPGVV
jgi:hypothetical protein